MDLTQRSYEKELLDSDKIPFEDIKKNMQELNVINSWLGGHSITISGINQLLFSNDSMGQVKKKMPVPLIICEIGCGGGNNLRILSNWCRKKRIQSTFLGIDNNPHCISFASDDTRNKGISFICSDYKNVQFEQKPGILFSSLFCHHFSDQQLISMLQWMATNCTIGFFINDLQRNILSYHSIKVLTRLFSRSYLVKNDAPISVLRGFTKNEWITLLNNAGITNYTIRWMWAFRWLVIVKC